MDISEQHSIDKVLFNDSTSTAVIIIKFLCRKIDKLPDQTCSLSPELDATAWNRCID